MTKKADPLTKAICNKGFSGNSSILPRSNFGVGGQESSPQSLTAYSLNRCAKLLAHFTTKSVRKQQRQNRNDFVIELCKWDLRKRILSSESLEKFDEVTRKK